MTGLLERVFCLEFGEQRGQEEIEPLEGVVHGHVERTHEWTPRFQHLAGRRCVEEYSGKTNEIHERYLLNISEKKEEYIY